ncbi:DHA2 family efflux MFS transporter permease subunit [Arthrobacter sp. 24S4-2]|uniref:DHA2 family efflux MFS transporter permease subunit n=1 Tax=Arthrobacter sp. 24S4-2 TaxID=2575374 RepID=UPI0010C78B39|nr:DHA2 family efflux MFS transporter permease subunit [Arthrobacter sp. 24S4-2]QCO98438.1 DHA2 family efflux MFS transporter permease subunit [Arthrobacter sp. 24S4-2]
MTLHLEAPATGARKRWAGLAVLAAGLSMIVIDGTIVGVSLPAIIADLKLDLSEAQWVNSLYSVVFAALLLTAGRLGDRIGRRRLFIAGVLIFLGGSLLAAMAQEAAPLISARVIQGIGGALVLPTTLSTVNATFRGKDRATAFGIWGAVISGAAAIGPLLGGWLTSTFSWQWIFLVNIPLGAAVITGAVLAVPETRARITAPGLDVDGLLLSSLGFGFLVFGLIEGSSLGWWTPAASLTVLGMAWPVTAPISAAPVSLLTGAVFLTLFVLWERHRARIGRSAILDLELFNTGTFRWGNLTAMVVATGEFGLLFVLPLFLVNVAGLSALGAGVILAAMAAGAFIAGAQARHLSARIGAPNVVTLGLGLEVFGVLLLSAFLRPEASQWLLAGLLAVYGLGLGLASAQLTQTTLADIAVDRSGQASATQSTVRQVGAALGAAVLGGVLSLSLLRTTALTGVPGAAAKDLILQTRDSAGGLIAALRGQGTTGTFGPQGPGIVQELASGFSDATRITLVVCSFFLVVGFAASLRVAAMSRRSRDA